MRFRTHEGGGSEGLAYEVVVVDDGSTDGTVEHLKAHAHAYPHLRLVEASHGGAAAARNRGVADARGEVIVFIDSDLVVTSDFLQEHALALERAVHVDGDPRAFTYGRVINTDNFAEPTSEPFKATDRSAAFFATGNVAISKRWLLEASVGNRSGRVADPFVSGPFDTDFTEYGWEDLELGERLRKLGVRMGLDASVAVQEADGNGKEEGKGDGSSGEAVARKADAPAPPRRTDLSALLRAHRSRPTSTARARDGGADVGKRQLDDSDASRPETTCTRHLPWDGTCKTLLRLSATTPFPRDGRASDAWEALRSFSSSQEASVSTPSATWKRASHVWTCRCRGRGAWEETFRSAYYAWRHAAKSTSWRSGEVSESNKDVHHLLVSHVPFTMLFVSRVEEADGRPCAMLAKSTPGARASLDDAGGAVEDLEEEGGWWEGGRVVDLDEQKRKKSESPLRFIGHLDVHGDASSSEVHFATLRGATSDDEEEGTGGEGDGSERTIEGADGDRGAGRWIPPWTVQQVLQAATECLPDGYEAEMRTDASTCAFHRLLDPTPTSREKPAASLQGRRGAMRHLRYRRGQYACTWTT
eukprot:jgi/Pico_ML_1/52964/g3593.t2